MMEKLRFDNVRWDEIAEKNQCQSSLGDFLQQKYINMRNFNVQYPVIYILFLSPFSFVSHINSCRFPRNWQLGSQRAHTYGPIENYLKQ